MHIYEVKQQLEVETPKGRGRIVYLTEYGMEIEKLFTVIINETGEFWEFTNAQIRATANLTFNRSLAKDDLKLGKMQAVEQPAAMTGD